MLLFIFVGCSLLLAQDTNTTRQTSTSNPPDLFKEMSKAQEQMKADQKKRLEMLKQINPQMYEQMARQEQLSDKISQISSSYSKKTISYESAKAKLYPLVKENLANQIKNLDNQIQMAEKKLEELKKSKKNPDYLVYQQIDMILGKSLSRQSM